MKLLWEVVEDLASFAWFWLRKGLALPDKTISLIAPPAKNILTERQQVLVEEIEDNLETSESVFKPIKELVASKQISSPNPAFENNLSTIRENNSKPLADSIDQVTAPMIVASTKAHVYLQPTKEFDTVIHLVPYGVSVSVHTEQGAWAKITHGEVTGWTERDNLASNHAEIKPFFVIKEYCGPEAGSTIRLRRLIGDDFYGAQAGLPLKPEEYVYYKLLSRGVFPPIVKDRPRQAGVWQKIFAGERGVHISVRPKTGSVMEYINEADIGHLAYVEAVFPDESISLSEVGEPKDGYYNERMLGKEVWQELSPVFIQFS